MVRKDRVIMRVTELRRVSVIRQTREQQLTHRGRGTPSNRRIPAKVKATALRLYAQR